MRKILRGHVFNKKFLFTLCLGLTLFVEAHAQVSGTFTINSAVATGGSNFQTFSAAVASLSGGVNGAVVFNVQSASGPYNEQVIINAITGTSATNTITFNCNGVTLQFLSTNSNQRAGVKLNGADYVTFDNLTVLPQAATAGQYGYGFHLLNDADHNTIKNCRITNLVDWNNTDDHEGIVINGNNGISYDYGNSNCDDNLIQNNTISGGSVGITLSSIPVSGAPVFMTGNKIVQNTISNTVLYGIQMFYSSGTLIDNNDISGGPDAIYDLIGMFLDYYNQSFIISNNSIHGFHLSTGSRAYGLYIASESASGKECLFSNNLIYDFQNDFEQYGIYSKILSATLSTSYLNIYHNTISLDDQSVPGTSAYGIYLTQVSDVNVMNNIVTVTRNSSSVNYGIGLPTAPIRFASQRNVIYVPDGPASVDAVGLIRGAIYNTMAAWQVATGFDYYSSSVNPLYVNAAAFNFRPTAQSIDNMAAYLNINTDITGAARNTTNPDPGCYEFTSTPCSTPITSGTVNVLPDSILCQGPKISLGLTGYSSGGGQTYTWQSATSATGTYTNISSPLGFPYFETTPTSTFYYRVALTCGATTSFSIPKRVLVNTTMNAGTYTINSALPTGGINFNSFGDAALALQCDFTGSIVFNVASGSGPYNEQLILPALNTSPTKTVTFNCNGVTMAYAPTITSKSAVVKLNGADYITIDSLNVDVQGATFGFGIQLMNDADHNTIKRCTVNLSRTVTGLSYAGIVINASDNIARSTAGPDNSKCDSNLIANNTVNGGCYGIILASNSISPGISRLVGNIVRRNTLIDNYLFGILLGGASKTLVDSNDISQPTRTVLGPFAGIYVVEVNFGITISRNTIHNLAENAKTTNVLFEGVRSEVVKALPGEPIVVSNNLMYTWRGSGLQYGINNISSDYIKYYHNTISLDDSSSGNPSITRGFGTFGSITTGVELKDNNIVVRRGGNGAKHGFYTNLNDSSLVANYNNYYIASAVGTNSIGFMTKDYPTLTAWLATRKDSASIFIDPVFYDVAVGDYTPTKIAFENRGSNVGIMNDIWNVTRNTTNPDIGAFEFTICKPLTAPVLTLESAGVNELKFAWTAVPYTTGYRVSRDGINWTIPSSGAFGTSHTIAGLHPSDSVNLMVKALGSRIDCPEYFSQGVAGKTLTDGIFIPNTFTPNGDSHNDVFKVYSNMMKSVRWMVFNQWGEKVFESNDINSTWDGNYKGKPQPIGVYVYVVAGTLVDGSKVNQKGSFNLIR